jgi:hypothetical protein
MTAAVQAGALSRSAVYWNTINCIQLSVWCDGSKRVS